MSNTDHLDYLKYLGEVKPGDTVVYLQAETFGGGGRYSVETLTVRRLTASQIVCTNKYSHEVRYRRSDGKKIGGRIFEVFPKPEMPEKIEAVKRAQEARQIARGLRDESFNLLSLEALREIRALVDKHKAEAAA